MTKRTRYKISLFAGLFLVMIALLSVFKTTETIGASAIAGMMTILTTYIWGETKRPSKQE
jgi:hypothetical protein